MIAADRKSDAWRGVECGSGSVGRFLSPILRQSSRALEAMNPLEKLPNASFGRIVEADHHGGDLTTLEAGAAHHHGGDGGEVDSQEKISQARTRAAFAGPALMPAPPAR